ncbi:MAG: PLDc N-terminal domain-containing protein [Pseudomonadota bacterium]
MLELTGLFGILLLVLDVWAIYRTFESSASTAKKAVWTVVIFLLPLLGLILWFLFGPKDRPVFARS